MLTHGERPGEEPGQAEGEQLALGVGWSRPVPRVEAWWVAAVEQETEGNQDTGWWDA